MSESAISAKSAKQIFANFVKFVKSIFGTTRRSEGSVTEAEYPTNYQRISNLLLTIRPFRVAVLAVLLVFVGGWNSEVWGNTATISGASFKDNRSWTGNHVKSFTISGSNSSYSSTLKALDIAANTNYTITWTKNSGCDITVTGIKCKIGNPNTWYVWNHNDLDVYINNSKVKTVGGWSSDDNVSKTGMSLGNNGSIVLKTTKDANIYSIEITYTITPNKPGVNPTTESVTVTLPANTANPTTINYKDNFSTSDHYGSYFEYAFDSNPNNKGVMSGDNFYATDSGTYKIKARIKAENDCHVASDWSYLTITVNPLDPSFTATNGSVDISVGGDIVNADLSKLVSGYDGNGTLSFSMVSASNGGDLNKATIDGNNFSATKLGTYRLRATYAATKQYRAVSREFDVAVGKRTPAFEWWNADGKTHIYASDMLENVAQAKYNKNNVNGLTYTYTSENSIVVVDGTTLKVQNAGFTAATKVTISVATKGTPYYEAGSDSHTYLIEPKATPEFWLNETINLPADPVQELHLLVGETATMRFVNTNESNFQYPTSASYISYSHNSDAHTGVITGTVAGDEVIQFHQDGTNTIFERTRSLHVYVNKHPVNLTTTLDGGTWKVDSIYDDAVYSIVTPTGGQPALSEVTVTSSNEAVLKKVDGHWKAVGEGEATLTISHPSTNDYWAGQTVTATITVVKHTPEFTWHLPATVNYNRSFAEPVSSTNTDEGCTFKYVSGNTAAINYVNGALKTFEKAASHVAITVTQTGNYKWAERSKTYYVNVEKLANHVELTVNSQAIYNAVYSNNSGEVYYDATSGIRLGGSSGSVFPINDKSLPAYNWDDKYIIITFEGVPDKVSFSYRTNNATASDANWYVQESANGVNGWSEIWSNGNYDKTSYASVTKSLKPSTRYLKLCYSGNFAGYFKNVHITERTEITGVKTVDFGATDAGSNPTDKTSNISWYNVNPLTLTIEGENASQFTVSPAEIASAKDASAENVPLTISYKHNRAAVKDTATLVITDGVTTKRIGLRGTTNKLTPAITWKENLTPMQRGVGVKNPATSPVAVTYTSTDPAVVAVIGDSIAPLKKGNATITASFDGTDDPMYNSNSSSIDVVVTDMKVQHINWTQTFTRLKYTTDPELSSKNTLPFALEATVSYYDVDKEEEVILDRPISFTSDDESVVKVIEGVLHVIGLGETTLTAHVEGIADSLFEATVVRPVKVHEPTADCEAWVLENKSGSINTISSKEFTLNGEGDSIYFDAWREPIKVVIEYSAGDLYLAEVYENGSENTIWHNKTPKNTPTSYKCAISREAKKVKFYTVGGATGYHNFSDVYVRRARYVELENTKGKTTHSVHFSTADAKPGVAKTKSFTVNYSNITDQLEMELKGGKSSKFSVVSPASKTIGTDCGEYGTVSVQVQFLSNEVESYKDTLVIHNLNQSVEVYLSAEVDKHHQQITWNPATELKTTDVVSFDATTSAAAAGLSVRYEVVEGDAATVNAETGALTIIKDGTVTIKATAAGNTSYYDAEPVSKTFTISKVTPEITTVPTATAMTLPNTNLSDCALTGGVASVAGTFAWADNTIDAAYNNAGYVVVFTPENTNWYAATTCVVVVPVNKASQTIVWDFNELEMFCNAQITFDAHSSTGLAELPVSYTTSDETIAYVDGNNHLNIIKGGEVTITATQSGNAIYAAAEPVSKTLTINRFAPTIVSLPNASTMKIGRVLSDASLTGGRAELNGGVVEGSFSWADGNTTVMNVAGTFSKQIVFTPANTNFYESVSATMAVTVEKYAPDITHNLQGSGITYGQPLSESVISGTITATDNVKIPSVNVEGTYAWSNPEQIVNAGENTTALVRFTPANTDWYEAVDVAVPLTVAKAVSVATPSAANIVYGQKVSESVLTNSGTTGTWAWTDEKAEDVLATGTYDGLAVHFTPSSGNYTEQDGTVSLTVEKAPTSLTWTAAPTELAYNASGTVYSASSVSDGAISYSIVSGYTYAEIDAQTGELTILVPGQTVTVQAAQAEGTNYLAPEAITINVTIGAAPLLNIFTNATGDGDWDVPGNWSNGIPTDDEPNVIISGDLIIDEEVTVGNLTIEKNSRVVLTVNGDLTVNGASEDRTEYGNLYVQNGGEVEINGGLRVGDLTVEASIGTSDGTAESGQVENAENIVYANAYIEINMDARGTLDDTKWYGFTVPFDVDARTGISRKENGVYRQCTYGTHYMIAEYDANKRLTTGKGWKYISGNTLHAGTFYYLTVDGNYNTYRFKAKEAAYTQAAPATLAMNGPTSDPNANWNAVGNSTLQHAKVSFEGGNYVQVYQNGLDAYRTVSANEATFVVGCPFFIQAEEESTLVLNVPTSATAPYYAPRRSSASQNGVARVNLTSVEGGYSDQIYISGTDKEEDAYIAGRDLAKAGESKVVPQLWVDTYNQKLSVHEAVWQGENAICPLGIYAPEEGEYTLTATQPEDGTQVYLTIDGMPVWNISETAYVLSLGKGTMNNYGLMLLKASRIPTNVENIDAADGEKTQKIILNDNLYILRDSRMYDVTGKKVK